MATKAKHELTEEISDRLVRGIKKRRVFDSHNAIAAGISPETLKHWLKMGLKPGAQEPYKTFAEKYTKERIEEEGEILEIITLAAKKDWRAAAWYLERKYPTKWGERVPATGQPEAIDVHKLVEEAGQQEVSLRELFDNPPPELAEVMEEKADEIIKFLEYRRNQRTKELK